MRFPSALLGATVAAGITLAASVAAAEPAVISEANKKWREARCTLRVSLELKKGKDGEGWTRSPAYSVGTIHTSTSTGIVIESATEKGENPFYFIFDVSDRDALKPILAGNKVPSRTEFIAEGWKLQRPEKQQGPYLQLRFAAMPHVKARCWFMKQRGFGGPDSFPIKFFEPVERYLRIEAFALEAADEQLTPLTAGASASTTSAPGQPAAPQPSTSASARAPAAASSSAYRPALRILAVSCQPARLRADEEVELVLTYLVEGIPPGASFEVVERREILLGDVAVGAFEKPLGRGAGTFTSTQKVRIPANAAPGLYSVRGTVTMAGISSSASALLELRGE